MARPRKSSSEIPGYWKDALPQKTGVRVGLSPAVVAPSKGKVVRRRNILLRYFLLILFLGVVTGVLYFGWRDDIAQETVAETMPSGPYDIEYETDGFIPKAEIFRRLGERPPPVFEARRRLETVGQIREVTVRRLSSEKISVKIRERRPVARLYVRVPGGEPFTRLISSEGVVYDPLGLGDEATSMSLRNLPFITGAKPKDDGNRIFVEGFEPVSAFLDLARTKYPAIYRNWSMVSLARYPGRGDAPGAMLVVIPRLGTHEPNSAIIREIVFSPIRGDFAVELDLLADPAVASTIRAALSSELRLRYPEYTLDLSLANESSPRFRVPEPRLIPFKPRQP